MAGSTEQSSRFASALALALTVWMLACAAWLPAQAATPVVADVSTNTTWRLADSPYLVSGDVGVVNNAVLTIEPGVQVRFEPQASLRVERGTLSAQGTSAAPIVFTSIHDDGHSTPAPGDWGVLGFMRDTHDASTILSHVRVHYGQGIVVEGASPTFNNLRIEHSAGPAIALDLSSSPRGQGLEASGNQINGILVPAGEIDTDVVWALRGIPYVLEQGTIHVGKSTFGLAPSQLQLVTGVLGTLEVTIPDPAPEGGLAVDVVSSVPSVAGVPSVVVVGEGERSAQIEVQANTRGTSIVSASAAGFGTVASTIRVIEPPALGLTPAQTVISIESGGQIVVSLSDVAPAGGREVSLAVVPEGVIAVPATASIPPGATSVAIDVAGLTLGTTTLTASAQGYIPASATVTVRPVSLNPPATLLVAPGLTRSMPILLTDPAPAGGLTISLESTNPAIATVPASVPVPAGASSVNVDVQGVAVGTIQVTASAPGYESGTTQVQVESVTIQLQPAGAISVPQGLEEVRTVRISRPAPVGGVWITSQTVDSAIAGATPASVFVPEGQTSATPLLRIRGESIGTTHLLLSAPGLPETEMGVSVGQPVRLEFTRGAVVVGNGLNTYAYDVYLRRMSGGNGYAPATSLTVNLVSADPGKVGVPATVTIPAGQYQAGFLVSGLGLTSEPVAINASAQGYIPTQTSLMATVVTPQLVFHQLNGIRGVGGMGDDFYVTWHVPGSINGSQTAISDQTIGLSIEDAAPEGLIPGFFDRYGNATSQVLISAGRNDSYGSNNQIYMYVATPSAAGTYKVGASLPGIGSWKSGEQTVVAPHIEFSRSTIVVGHGLNSYATDVYVRLRANNQNAPIAAPLTVNLVSTDPDKAIVPATVTIPANQYQVAFRVTGNDLTEQPVAVNASADGHASTQTPLMATVVAPQLQFINLDGPRGIGGANDDFYVRWHVPGSVQNPSYQTAISDQTIALSIEDASPEGLVAGFLDHNGNVASDIVIPAGQYDSYHYTGGYRYRYVATPTMAGTYKVGASLPGIGAWTSGTQTVVGAQLEFSRSTITAGHGLATYIYDVTVRLRANGQNAPTATPLTVTLTSADPDKVGAPTTVTIPAGQYETRFSVSGLELTSEPVAINASAPGYISTQTPLMATVVTPQLQFPGLDGARGVGGVNDDFYVRWHVPGSVHSPSYHTAISDQTIALSIEDASPEGLVAGLLDHNGNVASDIVIPAGQYDSYHYTGGYRYRYVATPTMAGAYKVGASLPGIGAWTTGTQTVAVPDLRFSRGTAVVAKGMNTYMYEVYLRRTVNGNAFYGMDALPVSLHCASSAVCTVPATATIPAGQHQTTLVVTGTGLGATKVIPSATGYLGAQELDVTTITPQLVLSGIPASLGAGATANFSVSLHTPGADYPNNQTAAVPIPIDLTSAQPSVATVPALITVSAGSRTASATLTATGVGTTTVTASGVDLVPVSSGTITVQQP